MKTSKYLLLSASLLGLAACGGSGETTGPTFGGPIPPLQPGEEAARVLSVDAGDAGQALSDGQTLTARQVALAGITLDYGGGDTGLTDADVFTVRLNGDGEVTLVLEGREIAFDASDREMSDDGSIYGYEDDEQCQNQGICDSLFSYSGEIDELKSNGNGWSEILRAQTNQLDLGGADLAAYAVVGTETADADLSNLATATYQGRARVDLVPATGFQSNRESRTRIDTDLSMTANFGAGTISGVLDEIFVRAPGQDSVSVPGTVAMTEAQFDINGFKGGFAGDAIFNANSDVELDDSSSYSGAFYGTDAQNVAGTISISGTLDGAATNGIGFFTGDQ